MKTLNYLVIQIIKPKKSDSPMELIVAGTWTDNYLNKISSIKP